MNKRKQAEISIDHLCISDDWDRIRPAWEELEKDVTHPPWGGFDFAELSWKYSGKPETYSILLKYKGVCIGGCFFHVGFQKYAGRTLKTLRLFDDIFFMYMPFLAASPGNFEKAVSVFFSRIHTIRRKTKADLLYLRRIDENSKVILQNELSWFRSLCMPMYAHVFTKAPQLYIPNAQNSEEALKRLQPKRLKKLRHQQVRMKKLLGSGTMITEHALHQLIQRKDWEIVHEVLDDFFQLRSRSWQHEWEESSPLVDHEILLPFMKESIVNWAEKFPVYIFFVLHNGIPAAFFLAAVWYSRGWGVFTGYDKDFHKFSVRQQAFIDGVSKLHEEEGIELFELGGEVIGWKEKWKTADILVYELYCSLSPFTLFANAVIWKRKLFKLA